jgi:hypothetical protein
MFASDHKRVCPGHPLLNLTDIREGMKYIDFTTANEHVIKKLLQMDESSAPDDPPSAAATSSNTTAASTKGAVKSLHGATSCSSLEGDESPDAGVRIADEDDQRLYEDTEEMEIDESYLTGGTEGDGVLDGGVRISDDGGQDLSEENEG